MEFKDYYKTLGVSKHATEAEIKAAFRKLARQHHPDLNPGNKAAENRFKVINEAHEILSDPEKRKKYDELGANWEQIERDKDFARRYAQPGFQSPEEFDLGDFFETFFGGRRGPFGGAGTTGFGPAGGPQPGTDVETAIELTLEELAHGGKRRLRLTLPEVCAQCHGEGVVLTPSKGGGRQRPTTAHTCPACGGAGKTPATRDLDVTIPRGLTDGARIRLAGQGGRGPDGGPGGDLFLRVHLQPHPVFRVEGHDLHADLPLYDFEAAAGGRIRVPTLGEPVDLTVPAETQAGKQLRLRGRGLPAAGGGAGDLYFHVVVRVPERLSGPDHELYAELARRHAGAGDLLRKRMFR